MANINDNILSSESQNKRIAEWLNTGHAITSLEALNLFGCMRLASRICDLRDQGLDIRTEKIKTNSGKWVTRYYINNTL